MKTLFWFSSAVIVYTYFGYPVLLFVISSIFPKPVKKRIQEPFVSVIISAFNEEKAIEKKLLNLLNLNYPEEKLEILIGSDGGSDQTDEIVSRFRSTRIRFFKFVRNFGKPSVLSALVEEAKGDIIVFTDSRQEFDREAIGALVKNFEDPKIGCVSGELYFKKSGDLVSSISEGMDFYWRYEKWLRKKESQLDSMLGATGAVYAARKRLFPTYMPSDVLVDDMYIPFEIIRKGYRAVFESDAWAFDAPSEKGAQELKRKTRTLAGNYQIFSYFPDLFNPFTSPVAWQLFSHKLMRLAVPLFLITLFISNIFILERPVYLVFFAAQILFYGLALSEIRRASIWKKGLGYIPYTFCLLNYSAVIGLIQFVKGEQKVNWEKAYV